MQCNDSEVQGGGGGGHIELTFSRFKQEFDALTDSVDHIGTVLLLGGEPLLNGELPEMVTYAAKSEKVDLVNIVTNCTILPSPALIGAAKMYNYKVFFGLSNYSSNPELAPVLKRDEIINILKENGIKHTLDTGDAMWFNYELLECQYTDEEMRSVFASCQWHHCLYVLDGTLAVCGRSLIGHKLGAFTLPSNEIIDIDLCAQNNKLRSELIAFYEKDFLSACRWCLKHEEKVKPALQEKI